jgi:hypothetical protein
MMTQFSSYSGKASILSLFISSTTLHDFRFGSVNVCEVETTSLPYDSYLADQGDIVSSI